MQHGAPAEIEDDNMHSPTKARKRRVVRSCNAVHRRSLTSHTVATLQLPFVSGNRFPRFRQWIVIPLGFEFCFALLFPLGLTRAYNRHRPRCLVSGGERSEERRVGKSGGQGGGSERKK